VGDDDLAQQLRAANDKEGLRSAYQVNKALPTGSCAAIISGHDRSLVTRLGAAESFSKAHLETPEVKKLIAEAKFFYMGGFFVTHGVESGLIIAKQAKANGVVRARPLTLKPPHCNLLTYVAGPPRSRSP
jgi:adenosine kinase